MSVDDYLEEALMMLGEVLDRDGSGTFRLVVAGGAALRVGGWVDRVTRDVDVLARRGEVDGEIISAWPLDENLVAAVAQVASELRLPKNWLNASVAMVAGPLDELPKRVWSGSQEIRYGQQLRIEFIGREGLIDLKVRAALDPTRRHDLADLKALSPTVNEFENACGWLASIGLLDKAAQQRLETLSNELF